MSSSSAPFNYPSAPSTLPEGFSTLPKQYYYRAMAVVVGILLFVSIYLGALYLSFRLLLLVFSRELIAGLLGSRHWLAWVLYFGACLAAGMFFVFLFKFVFKQHRADRSQFVEITDREQPQLMAFIRKVCQEANAPLPKRVYLTYDVNAFVFYDSTLWSLVLPVQKNLVIGLGLLNYLNLTEFKAVLAHEFGHFSQKTMRMGSYVYMAQRILQNLVVERDSWDNFLTTWRQLDLRLSAPAHVLGWLVGLIRWLLLQVYKLLLRLNASLSRQMEFQADLVAVQASGSDGIVYALERLGAADETFGYTWHELEQLAQQQVFSTNFFYHHREALTTLRALKGQEGFGEPRNEPSQATIFDATSEALPQMYDSHPPNYLREQNAKRHYLPSDIVPVPARSLLAAPEAIEEKLTALINRQSKYYGKGAKALPAEEVMQFVAAERADQQMPEPYGPLFNNRDMLLKEDLESERTEMLAAPDELLARLETLLEQGYPEAKAQVEAAAQHLNGLVEQINQRKKEIILEGKRLKPAEAVREAHNLKLRHDVLVESRYRPLDSEFVNLHVQMARALDAHTDLLPRVLFQHTLQDWHNQLLRTHTAFTNLLEPLTSGQGIKEEEVDGFERKLMETRRLFLKQLEETSSVVVPSLPNLPEGQTLHDYLDPDGKIKAKRVFTLNDSKWLEAFMENLTTTHERCQRLHRKSLGYLLRQMATVRESFASAHSPQVTAQSPKPTAG